ncbi:helix-turn-helix domain-containing protein [Colwelliaceae bacterium 6471]
MAKSKARSGASAPFNSRGMNSSQEQYVKCQDCAMNPVCGPVVSGGSQLSLADSYLTKRCAIQSGEQAFEKHAPLKDIFAVCSGVFKLCDQNEIGEEKIVGFRFAGELLGDDAISPNRYNYKAIAIGKSSLCKVAMSQLVDCSKAVPNLQLQFISLLTKQNYLNHQGINAIVAKKTAESLLVAFLLNIAKRINASNEQTWQFDLPMSRDDIANFLGLRRETLSRILTKLQKGNLIMIQGKNMKLLNVDVLSRLANQ